MNLLLNVIALIFLLLIIGAISATSKNGEQTKRRRSVLKEPLPMNKQ